MKTAATLLISLLAFTSAAAAPIRVACVGDSITFGYGSNNPYPKQLQGMLGDKWLVQNFGINSRTLLKKGDHPYWTEKLFKDAQDFQPDVVIIMLGTNDTKPANWPHHDEFYADYKDLVETFKNLASKPKVFVCRPCPIYDTNPFQISEANMDLLLPLLDQLAAEEKIGLIDMHAAMAGQPGLEHDGVHPGPEGDTIMARTAAAALTGKAATP